LEFLEEHVWKKAGGAVYAVFVDFKAAFDRASRQAIFRIVRQLEAGVKLQRLLLEILQEDQVIIFNGENELAPIQQTTGLAQGDCLSPLLFVLLLAEFPRLLREEVRSVRVTLYADDVVLYGTSRAAVQLAIRVLERFCQGKGLVVNEEKTVGVKFRRGGRMLRRDQIWVNGKKIRWESQVTYLGVQLSCCGSVEGHVKDRTRRAKVAIARIRKPQLLSISAALAVFELCIAPMASYGITMVWQKMKVTMLAMMESVKATFVKKCLGVATCTSNRLVYSLLGQRSFVEELMMKHDLPLTPEVALYLKEFRVKIRGVLEDGFLGITPAGQDARWREAGRPGRSLVIRASLGGLHNEFCYNLRCFEATSECICRHCSEICEQFHLWSCLAPKGVEYRSKIREAQRCKLGIEETVNNYV